MTLAIKAVGMKELLASLARVSENLPRDVYSALGVAGTKVKSVVAKEVVSEIRVAQKLVKAKTKVIKNRQRMTVTVELRKSAKIPLKYFGATHDKKKKGATAKINTGKGGKKLYQPGFVIAKFGGHAFTRPDSGRKIARLHGPSPYGVLTNNRLRRMNVVGRATHLVKLEMERRIRFVELKKAGKLNWQ